VGAGVLSQVVTARELLATLIALERLVLSVERAVVALEVLLTTEATRAKSADEGLGRVFGQGLLATAAVDRDGSRLGGIINRAVVRAAVTGRLAGVLRLVFGLLLEVLTGLAVAALLGLGLLDDILLALDVVLGPPERGETVGHESLGVLSVLKAVLAEESVILNRVSIEALAFVHVHGIGGRVELNQAVQLIVRVEV
jgi:hypothetical protein